MSQFFCICGGVTQEGEEPRDASGVLHSIADLQDAEDRAVRLIVDYFSAPDRRAWVRGHFEFPYPDDASDGDVTSDILSRELSAKFVSVFRCPQCGRIAMKGKEEDKWKFFGQ